MSEVCIVFHGRILRGNRSTKFKSTGFDAFESPNFAWLGKAGIDIELRKDLLLSPGKPQLSHTLLERIVTTPSLRGLILQTYGVGNTPSNNERLLDVLRDAIANGLCVVNITRCSQGRVLPTAYDSGSVLSKTGVLAGKDMTFESTFTKLHVLIGMGLEREEVRQEVVTNWSGEVS